MRRAALANFLPDLVPISFSGASLLRELRGFDLGYRESDFYADYAAAQPEESILKQHRDIGKEHPFRYVYEVEAEDGAIKHVSLWSDDALSVANVEGEAQDTWDRITKAMAEDEDMPVGVSGEMSDFLSEHGNPVGFTVREAWTYG